MQNLDVSLSMYTEEQLNDYSFIQDQLHACEKDLEFQNSLDDEHHFVGEEYNEWVYEVRMPLVAKMEALRKLLKGFQQPTGVKMNLTREDGRCLFVEENAKKFPAAPLRAILLSQKGKLERGNLGDLEYFYFRYIPHDQSLPEKFLEVNLKWQDVEEILEQADCMLQQSRNRLM